MKVTVSILIALQIAAGVFASSSSSSSSSTSTSSSAAPDAYGSNFFADTQNTYYDGYQQAWRYLGWYVKCGYPTDRYSEEEEENSHDSGDHSGDDSSLQGDNYCQRYLIWAAYVDENYGGGGIGEYHYYDSSSGDWDYSACEAHPNSDERCAPMDCHFTNTTTWKLMGVFKEAGYFGDDAFFEQLFKHEGVCVWDDEDTYEFMSDARTDSWTEGCVATGYQGKYYYGSESRPYLYLDLKPTWNGNMTYGLYTDSICKTEYEGSDIDVDTVSKAMGLLYGSSLQQWNDALEPYKVCQPCRAYNLKQNYVSSSYDSSDPNEGYFQCDDDAGYTNVNQCMKFRTHADLEVATWEDLVTATNQGGILEVNISGTIFGSDRMAAEEYLYLQTERKSAWEKSARKAAKFAAMEATTTATLKPKAKIWQAVGGLTVGIGSTTLLLVLYRAYANFRRHQQQQRNLSEPLL